MGQRLIPVAELERFLREHLERGCRPATIRRLAGRPPALPEEVVDRIRLECTHGRSLGEIARGLTADGVPTAYGGRWWPSTVRAVLLRLGLPATPRLSAEAAGSAILTRNCE